MFAAIAHGLHKSSNVVLKGKEEAGVVELGFPGYVTMRGLPFASTRIGTVVPAR